MESKQIISGILVLIIVVIGYALYTATPEKSTEESQALTGLVATIHKSPFCGCCGVYSQYMKREGYDVVNKDHDDMTVIKDDLGVPHDLGSCHTTEIEGYVIEGHIPNEAIEKLLAEKPDIKGIGMPGMPSGAPGMPGPKRGDFVIHTINNDGSVGDIFMTI